MYSSFNKKCHHFSNLIIGLFISLFMISSCEHEIPVENQTDTTPTASVRNLNATAGDKTVYLSWTNPSDSDFYGTRITFSPSVSGVSQPVVIEGESSENSSTVFNGLKNGIEYTFTLVALDKNQNKSKTVSIKATPKEPADTTPPKEVTELKAEISDTSVILTWKNPDDSDFSSAQITFIPDANGIAQPIIIEGKSSEAASTTIHGLENNVVYTFTLKTIDKKQNQSQGVQIKATISDTTPPEEVKDITTEIGDKAVILMWTNPDNSDFSSTLITFTPEVEGIEQPVIVDGKPSETSKAKIEGLEYDTEYTFTLKTIDKKQNQSNGIQIKTTPTDTYPPEKIKDISAVAGDKAVTLSWTNPGATDFEGIQITFTPEVSYIPQPLVIRGEANKTANTTISGLQNDTTYTFKITAFDKVGNKSETVSVKASPCDKTPPAEITNISATAEDKSVTILWTNPSDTDFTKTQITFTPEVEDVSQPIFVTGLSNKPMEYTINDLQNDTEYTFTLKTIDNNNNASEGKIIKVTPEDRTPPEEISDFTLVPNHNRITLNWLNPSDIDFYGVEISSNPASGTLSQPVFLQCNPSEQKELTILNLENDVEYEFTIKTIDTYNNKSEGIQKKAVPKASTLSMSVTLPNDNGHITLTNDKAPIQVSVSSSHEITKAVWKKIETNDSTDLETLINNPQATSFNIDNSNDETIINVTENGFYSIVVQNEEGLVECKTVQIKTIDKTPLPELTTFSVSCDGKKITVIWRNPTTVSQYDAPIREIIISYIYNDDANDVDNSEKSVTTFQSVTNCSTLLYVPEKKSLDDYVRVTIKIIDQVGNITESTSELIPCFLCKETTIQNIKSSISNLTENAKIIVSGNFENNDTSSIKEGLETLYSKNDTIKVSLDLTATTGLSILQSSAFYGCSNLSTIYLPNSITEIKSSAFQSCEGIKRIELPNNLRIIGVHAFDSCSSLKTIYIPENILYIEQEAFARCTSLETINIPKGISTISKSTFLGCKSLSQIIIPKGITTIDETAFSGCSVLSSITLSNTITNIKDTAFKDCVKLTAIHYSGTIEEWCTKKFSMPTTTSYNLYIDNIKIQNVNIPKIASKINDGAFAGCISISEISISDGITSIGDKSFFGCTNLKNIHIPASITSIGKSAFYGCKSLSSIIIPEGVKSIGASAFRLCTSLRNITIPSSLTSTDDQSFPIIRLTENPSDYRLYIYYTGTLEQWCTKTWSFDADSDTQRRKYDLYINNEKVSNIVIPDNITSLSEGAFCGCSSIINVTISDGVNGIGRYAFEECPNLVEVTIPETVISIGYRAFYLSKNLKNLNMTGTWINSTGTTISSDYASNFIYQSGASYSWSRQ